MHFHFLYVAAFTQRCGIIYVSGGSLTLRYKDKENLLINGCPRNGHGDAPCAPARQGWAGADKAQRDGRATIPCGGSRGPADPWSAAAASKRRGEALERLCREIAQRCADGRSASEPVPLFPAAVQAAIAKGLGLCLTSTRSRKNNDMSRSCKKDGHKPNPKTKQPPTPRPTN